MILKKKELSILFLLLLLPSVSFAAILFEEHFEDANFSSRGWYDGTGGAITTLQYKTGTHAYECHFLSGGTNCAGGDLKRMKFTGTDSIYISYWLKLSSNWVGSKLPYHPHMIFLMTNLNGDYDGFYGTYTTAYNELSGAHPRMGLQDASNIDNTKIGVNLCNTTETRAVNGCNGICDDPSRWDLQDCYDGGGGVYLNGRMTTPALSLTTNAWHFIEVYYKMNSISGGKGQNDGIMQMWVDGTKLVDFNNIIYRTNQHSTMQFNQFALSPYIGDGSPVDQYLWIDDLVVATSRSIQGIIAPSSPSNLRAK